MTIATCCILGCYIYLPLAIIAFIMQGDDVCCNDIKPSCSWGLREHCIKTPLYWHMVFMIENLSGVTQWWMTTKHISCQGAETAGCSAREWPWAAGDPHGAGRAGSWPARACPTTLSQGTGQIWGIEGDKPRSSGKFMATDWKNQDRKSGPVSRSAGYIARPQLWASAWKQLPKVVWGALTEASQQTSSEITSAEAPYLSFKATSYVYSGLALSP